MNNQLRREPAELLEVVRHNYKTQLDSDVHAAFPVVLRQSLETLFFRFAKLACFALVVVFIVFFVTGSNSIAVKAGIAASIIAVIFTGSEITLGVVAVTNNEFVLFELDQKARFRSGEIIERINIISNPLPEPRAHKGGMLGDSLPFKKNGDRGWYYAGLTDCGTGYIALLEELRLFQNTAATETPNKHLEPQFVG